MKGLGLILVSVFAVALGFRSASRLTARRKALDLLILNLGEISSRIQLREEKRSILLKVFGPPFTVSVKSDVDLIVSCPCFNQVDSTLLNEFIEKLGMGDVDSQLELCNKYAQLIKRRADEALQSEKKLANVYRTCGVLAAAALVVLFI